ncbi:MAG: hypothetical protein K2F83_04865 [Oscillospiraceae bacterium]|nr:hypothetical protein [Oscillospiraceae bacterium]
MVGWLRWSGERGFFPKLCKERPLGLSVLTAALPAGKPRHRLAQGATALRRRGVRRVVLAPGLGDSGTIAALGLQPVDPLPLCRAMGAQLALTRLKDIPLRERRVALRGEKADPVALALAQTLCPQTGALLLDFDRGGEELSDYLHRRYGAAPLTLGNAPPPQVTLELGPRANQSTLPGTLKLWGEPDLGGLELWCDLPIPADLPRLEAMALLWEAGRMPLSAFQVRNFGHSHEEIP